MVLALAAAVLAVSACGGKAANSGDRAPIPGAKEFGLTEEQFVAHVEKSQSLIAKCMTEAGFEYVPADVKSIIAAQKRVRSDPGLTRRQYKEKYGLAVTTRLDHPVRELGLGTHNLKIYKSLSEPNQVAYDRALYGDHTESDFAFTLDEEDFSRTGGCTRKAVEKVFTGEQVSGNYSNPKDVLINSDPRIEEAREKWGKCMRDGGYNYIEDQDEIIEDYRKRLEELAEGADPATLTGERAVALRKLQADEIAAAVADLNCQEKFTDKITRQVEVEVYGYVVSG